MIQPCFQQTRMRHLEKSKCLHVMYAQELLEGRSGYKGHGDVLAGEGTVLDSDYDGNDPAICACQKLWSCTRKCVNFTVE